jgi:hypothetical protein
MNKSETEYCSSFLSLIFFLAHWTLLTQAQDICGATSMPSHALQQQLQAMWVGDHSEACERIVDNALDQRHLLIAQFLELALTALLGQSSIVLSDEHHQVFSNPVRHFD